MENHPNRKPNRLKDYDYSQNGYYFVTICIKNREWVLGDIDNGKMILNEYGKIAEKCWLDLPNHYKNCFLDEFIIMPDHMHGIVIIENVGNGFKPFPTHDDPKPTIKNHGLSEIMRGFKTFSSKNINIQNHEKIFAWQKSFHDHIIRNEKSLSNIREYIRNNPVKWESEKNKNHF